MYKKQFGFLFLFVISFISVFYFSSAQAATNIIDDVSEDTTWTLNNSPYVIKDSIMVWPGVTLTIEPGVIVKFAPRTSIDVLGGFSAEGAVDKHIFFTSLWDDSIGGDTNGDGNATIPIVSMWNSKGLWYGVYFNSAENVSLENSDISFSINGFYFWLTDASISNIKGRNNQHDLNLREDSNINLSGGDFYGSLYESVYLIDSMLVGDHITVDSTKNWEGFITFNSNLSLIDSVIKDIKNFGEAIGAEGPGTINLERTTIKNSRVVGYTGIVFNIKDSVLDNSSIQTWDNSTFNIGNSIIQNAQYYGIEDYGGDIFNITKSKIINNYNGGIYLYLDARFPNSIFNISDSTISNNGEYGVYNRTAYPINFKNVWWGDASGPYHPTLNPSGLGNAISDNVFFDPWCKSEKCETGNSSVLFLPGLEASRLYTSRVNGSEDQLWEPNWNSDVEDLYMNTDGISINPDIYTRDIIKESNTPFPTGSLGLNIYKSFANTMDDLVTNGKIAEWKPYAYDWRTDVNDIVNNGTKYQNSTVSLVDTLQSLVGSSKNGKVTIIAHSNGGILAKALLKKLQDDKIAGRNNLIDSVDVLILVAVPEIGTASAVPAMLHGYDQAMVGGWLMDETRARELGRNTISAFGLLPSKEYINRVSASPVTFVDNAISSNVTTNLVQAFGSALDSYVEYKNFLFGGEGRINPLLEQINLPISLSQSLFSKAESLHNGIDAFVPPVSMRVIELAGWGIDTVASFEYYPLEQLCPSLNPSICPPYMLDERPRFTSDGDKTVVAPSAQYMSSMGNSNVEKYWVNINKYNRFQFPRSDHASILEVNPLLDFISSTIQKITLPNSVYISSTVPVDDSNRLRLSIHSPVTLDAYDSDGNHTGKICPTGSDFCYVEENIPNSSYLEFGEGKYLNLPEDKMHNIKLQGTDVGTFTYDSEKVLPDGTSTVSSFVDIPVTTETQAVVTLDQAGIPKLALDVNGDGTTDFTLAPNSIFDPIVYLQIMKATIDSLDIPKAKIIAFDNRVDTIIKSIQKGKIDQAKLKASKFTHIFENTLSKNDPKNSKPHKLSKADAQLLLDMLNKLLDNIN